MNKFNFCRPHQMNHTHFGFEVWGKTAEEVKEDEAEDAEGGENLGLAFAKPVLAFLSQFR